MEEEHSVHELLGAALASIMPRTLFLLTPLKMKGGNYGTISRIRSHLVKNGHSCLLWDLEEMEGISDINAVLEEHHVDLVIGIHAFRTGRFMKDSKIPYILILGGTDVNEFHKKEEHMSVMSKAVYKARFVIAFNESLQKRALNLWPHISRGQLAVIKQAVITNPCDTSTFCLHTELHNTYNIEDPEDKHIFLLVGAVRSVKNPVFIMDTISEWHKENPRILFLVIGPVSDQNYYQEEFKTALERCQGVVHIPGLPFESTHAAMQQAFALVNSSQSEGMSLAILEAMQLGLPVLARDIPGNSSIVQDGKNGLLFCTPQEFREKAARLLSDISQQRALIENAKEYVSLYHSANQEEMAYLDLVNCSLTATDLSFQNGYR